MTNDEFISYLTSAAIAVALILITGNSSLAAELNMSITVDDNVVRLGDVFDDAGGQADLAIAEAPAPGMKSRIAVKDLMAPAQRAGIAWQAPQGITHISVERRGLPVTTDELRQIISDKIKRDGYAKTFDVTLYRAARPLQIPVDASSADISVTISSYDERTGNFVAGLAIPNGSALKSRVEIRGKVEKLSYVPGLNKQIAPGETITESDIAWVRIQQRRLGRNMVQSKRALIGMTPRRPLAVNQPLRLSDIHQPVMVKKGSQVMVAYRYGNLTISSAARALENGVRGEVIRILNTRSNRTLEGVVTGPGRVELAAREQFALLGR